MKVKLLKCSSKCTLAMAAAVTGLGRAGTSAHNASGVYLTVLLWRGHTSHYAWEVILVEGKLSITLNIDLEALQWTCSMLGGSLICES